MKRSRHDRAIRGYPEYDNWKRLAEFLDAQPKIPELLRWIQEEHIMKPGWAGVAGKRANRERDALEVLLKDKYPSFLVMERLKGESDE